MKHAVKLGVVPNPDWYAKRRHTRILGQHVHDGNYGLTRRYVSRLVVADILSILPPDVAASCSGVNYSSIRELKAHVHTEDRCVINMYQSVCGAKTVFYEGVVSRLDGVTSDNGNKYYLVNDEHLTAVEGFTAERDDVWLLNTRQPHAVLGGSVEGEARSVIQVFLNMPFEEARERIV